MARLDLVIFGATGFTGRKVVEKTVRLSQKNAPLSWSVAGRSRSKLVKLMDDISKITGEDLSKIKITIADVNDEQSLKEMCSEVKVVVNCCGPYQEYGEAVVRAAVGNGAHYVDVAGEPQFMESMLLKYDVSAREARVYVISACGFDSIPNDMGVVYLQQNFNGTLHSVESYVQLHILNIWQALKCGFVHYASWKSLILSMAHMSDWKSLRKYIYQTGVTQCDPKLQWRSIIHKNINSYNIFFPGPDNYIVSRTQQYLYEHERKRPAQFRAYLSFPNFFFAMIAIICFALVYVLSYFSITRKLLLNYPRLLSLGIVSHEGPTEEVMQNSYFRATLRGKGWDRNEDIECLPPNKKIVVEVSGMNPGYGATATALVLSALTVLKEQDKMPSTGGVLTTGAAFQETNLIKNLIRNNFIFELV